MSTAGFLYSLPATKPAAWVVKPAKGSFAALLAFGLSCCQKPLLSWAQSLNGLCLSCVIAQGSSKTDSSTKGPRVAGCLCVK